MVELMAFAYRDILMPITTLRQLATIIRSERTRAGLSQAQLAERAGVSRWWISQFESGKARAELGLMLNVLDALDLVLDISRPADRSSIGAALDLDHHLREYSER